MRADGPRSRIENAKSLFFPSLMISRAVTSPLNMLITRGISLVNFAVASSALAFQVFVLYPWHNQLDHEFKDLKEEHRKVLRHLQQSSYTPLKE
ncbi:hypothetical protein BJY01DRAFT_183284 [Aspergillus pseudoustus]|uniref:Mitochondrial phosphate carrier protein n=1 Tax=Aspergillus pseudoustus TaxID=1810923 RepID=A0ABR4JYY8_9EURO